MLTDKQFQDIGKNGITFELSKNGKYANIYKKVNLLVQYLEQKILFTFVVKNLWRLLLKKLLNF